MIRENLALCREKIRSALQQAGRASDPMTLVAVTKGVALPRIYEALECGIRDIGENRLQEALLKYSSLNAYAQEKGFRLIWHMVGHLQTNKVREAVRIFDLIHSVDSVRLAVEIDKQAAKMNKVQDVLLEINASQETTKFGFPVENVAEAIKKTAILKNIHVRGLMTVARVVDTIEKARPYFLRLRELKDKINQLTNHQLTVLSMGMTDDFPIAVQEGATMVRIGRGIFGERLP